MTGKIYLCGGGDEKQTYEVDEDFLKNVKTILYIPWAWPNDDFKSCEKWFQNCMKKHKEVKIRTLTEIKIPKSIEKYDAIYIGGGNTFKLLGRLKEVGLDKKLIKLYKKGKKIYGGSAGALIWGSDIKTAFLCMDKEENMVNLRDTSGLNFVSNHDIQAHFEANQIKEHQEYISKTGRSIIAIPEDSALRISEKELLVVGLSPITIISKDSYKTFKPNSIAKI